MGLRYAVTVTAAADVAVAARLRWLWPWSSACWDSPSRDPTKENLFQCASSHPPSLLHPSLLARRPPIKSSRNGQCIFTRAVCRFHRALCRNPAQRQADTPFTARERAASLHCQPAKGARLHPRSLPSTLFSSSAERPRRSLLIPTQRQPLLDRREFDIRRPPPAATLPISHTHTLSSSLTTLTPGF
jgi:hypothetical protein